MTRAARAGVLAMAFLAAACGTTAELPSGSPSSPAPVSAQPSPVPSAPPSRPPASLDRKGEFCTRYRALLAWWFLDPTTDVGSQAWAGEVADRFHEMLPYAAPELHDAIEVHTALYVLHELYTGNEFIQAAVPWAVKMPEAVATLDGYCDIQPHERGMAG